MPAKTSSRVPRQLAELPKQVLEFQKAVFDGTFDTLASLQDRQEKLLNRLLKRIPGLSDDALSRIEQWQTSYKRGRTQFKKRVDAGFERVERYFDRGGARAGSRAKKPAAKKASAPQSNSPKAAGASEKPAPPRSASASHSSRPIANA